MAKKRALPPNRASNPRMILAKKRRSEVLRMKIACMPDRLVAEKLGITETRVRQIFTQCMEEQDAVAEKRAEVLGELKNPYRDNLSVLPEAKLLYQKNCAQCHGQELKGEVGPPLTDLDKPDAQLFTTVYGGSPAAGMPAFNDTLGKERIWKLVTFLKSLQKH